MATVRIAWDDTAVKLTCADPSSAPSRGMAILADELVLEMKRRCPTGPDQAGPAPGHPRQRARKSGTLRSSIRKFRQPDGNYLVGPTDEVAPGVFLGPMIERGTPAHSIDSHGPWPLYSTTTRRRYGKPVYAGPPGHRRVVSWHVDHPGTRPQPFIEPAVRAMSGRRVVVR